MAELHDLTALEQGAAVRRGEVSPIELTEHHLARVARWDAPLGAFVTVTSEAARAAARSVGDRVAAARRRDGGETLGPLAGVPTAVKDLARTAGVRTTYGSAAYVDQVPDGDDHAVRRLAAAGLVSLGKTNTPEFGLPCYTEPAVAPPARTPWDPTRSAGGSSGGAGAAVAAGLVPIAHGSDGGGSLRIPASVCGLVGLKPSRGRVSAGPLAGDVAGLGQQGSLARTVADAAALLDVLAGYEPGDPHWAPPPTASFLAAATGPPPGRLRIARFRTPPVDVPVDRECVAAYEDASLLLDGLGHEVVDVPMPVPAGTMEIFLTVWAVLATLAPVPDESALTPLTRMWRDRGSAVSGTAYVTAFAAMQGVARAVVTALLPYDAVLTPTLAMPPVPVGWFTAGGDPVVDLDRQLAFTPYTSLWNVTGQPAISLPTHWTAGGLPVGVMLAGRPAGEAALLALAAQVEAARPWRDRHPELWRDGASATVNPVSTAVTCEER